MPNPLDLEKAQVMFKLFRKGNWNNVYDRTEHFNRRRFPNLDLVIKDLNKIGWLVIHKKPQFLGLALNTQFKKEIILFIEEKIPSAKGFLK